MKRSTFLAINAVIGILFGIGLLLMPLRFLSSYGVTLDPIGDLLGRDVGAFLIGFGLLNALVVKAPDSNALRGILLANLTLQALTFSLDLRSVLIGVVDVHGWGPVAQHAVLGLGFAWYAFKLRSESAVRP